MTPFHIFSSAPDEVKSLKLISRVWTGEGFWSFDDCLTFLSSKAGTLFYLGDPERWQAVTMFSVVLDQAELVYIYVPSTERKNGLAGELLKTGIEELRGSSKVKNISLEVRESNTAAIKLYGKLGFQKVGVRKGYYRDGEDGWLMQLGETP